MKWTKDITVPAPPRVPVGNIPTWWLEKRGIKPGDKLMMLADDETGNLVIRPYDNDMTQPVDKTNIKSASCNGGVGTHEVDCRS
jgi:bifunctional DNA-binding transcriptional regulator/antitoxin component of YhaV-PrlF toxin-antitoxin module